MASEETKTKETKAQRAERLKREKNPWEAFDELCGYARKGFPEVPPEWLGTYLRWWGVYTQGDGHGVVGGQGGEGKSLPCFMVRIRIPGGILRAGQMRAIADLSRRFGRGVADITVRQNIQLHWVTAEALPEVLTTLDQQGLSSIGACGDVVRNVTSCPVAGLDADEICDPSPLSLEGIAAAGWECRVLQPAAKIQSFDHGLSGVVHVSGDQRCWPDGNYTASCMGKRKPGFSLRVGGGLSADPHLAVRLECFRALGPSRRCGSRSGGVISRVGQFARAPRAGAAEVSLFALEGWTAESFQRELERKLGYRFDSAEPEQPPQDVYRDHLGIHPQKQEGLCYVGAAVLRGRVSADQLQAAAEVSERLAAGDLRTTAMQNLLIVNVPRGNANALAKELDARIPGAGFFVHARDDRVQRDRILQTRDHRDEEFFALACRGTRRAASRFRSGLEAARDRLSLTVADSTGLPTLGWKARSSRSMARWWMLTTSAWGDLLEPSRRLRGRSDTAARHKTFPTQLSGCCGSIAPRASPGKICAGSLRGTTMHSFDNFSRARTFRRWNAISRRLWRRTRWRAERDEHGSFISDVFETCRTIVPGRGSGAHWRAENPQPSRLRS